jgi:fucokinase
MAVSVDGHAPLACRCRIIRGRSGVALRAESRSPKNWKLTSSDDVELKTLEDLQDFHDPSSPCALVKCALLCLGFANSSQLASPSINVDSLARKFFSTDEDVGVEIISTSLLPQGSGMGTSSILAGCILAAIAHCRGVSLSTESLIHCVLELEQRLTTGGGFQDQANGLVGGVKRISCEAGVVQPVHVHWQQIRLSANMRHHIDNCLHLIYTGKTRLAKNLLLQCLERWSTRSDEICDTVSKLVSNANTAVGAFEAGDLDQIGRTLEEYWAQKKAMAGPDSGVEPAVVRQVLDSLKKGNLIRAGSLCGAGGGGFMVLLGKDGVTAETMKAQLANDSVETNDLVWHKARLDDDGMTLKCVEDDKVDISIMYRG